MISLSKNTVSATGAANWSLTPGAARYFATQGSSLITIHNLIPAGFNAVKVRANAQNVNLRQKARFVIQVM
jgi:hypothetical protein